MSYELNIRKKPDFLHVRVTGVRTRAAVVAMAKDILGACVQHQPPKVLVDVRELKGRGGTLDAYEVPSVEFPKLKRPGLLKKAVIVDVEEFKDSFRFFETVARNRGFNLRIFGDMHRAIEWLREGEGLTSKGT